MKANTAQKVLEYLQKHSPVNTFRLSRDLKINRIEVIKIVKELASQGLAKFKSDVAAIVKKEEQKKGDESSRISAMKALDDAHPDRVFRFCNGLNAKNLHELLAAFQTITDGVYQYHANNEKNDFSNWIKDVLGDEELASSLKMRSREEAIIILETRIKQLKG